MSENQSNDTLPTRPAGARLTIGFIGFALTDKYTYTIWQGVMDAARARGVNLISFSPRDLGTTTGFEAQANVLHDLVSTDLFDGLVILTDPLLSSAGPERANRVLERYRSKPMVTITGSRLEGIPRLEVEIDQYQPMRAAVLHLVKEHGYRRIAFIRGPDVTNEGARARYQAYVDVLAESGLPLDSNLVSPPTKGLWGPEVGQVAIALLLDERGLDVEAVVGANDNFALGAMQALQARGIHIPNQIAVVGFDDQSGGDSVIPPLTTVLMPGYDAGRQAAEMLLTMLEGGQVLERTKLLPPLIIRQSCGCANPAVAQAATGTLSVVDKTRKTIGASEQEKIISEMQQVAGTVIEGLDSNWAEQLLAAFLAELKAETTGVFLSTLDGILRRVIAAGGPVATWANVISALRRSALPYLDHNLALRRAEGFWLQAQVMVGETAQLAQRFQTAQAEQQAQILDEIRAAITTTFDVEGLMDTLAQELPRLSIPGCYLSLYENPQRPTETSRLILAYDEQRGRLELPTVQQLFPSCRLVPEGMLPQGRPYSMVVESLYFREQQLGFVLFESGSRYGPIYDELRTSISSALRGALLFRERERAKVALERAYSEVEQQVQERTAELQREITVRERLQQEVIEAQKRAIAELSTPVIPVLARVIIMPLIGSIDSLRARDITRALLAGISQHHAKVVILDVTGVPLIDSGVANHLNKTIQAARLKGTRTIITGISEAVAETIVDLGIDWSHIETMSDLQTGLRAVLTSEKQRDAR
jgi:DNA-binding LacI/PurR family transcriptional regulator/anti-anti-sigma regulatory factor